MLNNIMQIAINHKGESYELEVKESGTTHAVHSVSIAYRDLLINGGFRWLGYLKD